MILSFALVGFLGPAARIVQAQARGSEPRAPAATHVVRPGDTLWSIARSHADPGEDVRPLVHAIVAVNDADPGALVPGQRLLVPTV